jgi:hypothetical protein
VLIKKLWYSRNQGTVATTNPADHQPGQTREMTGQKGHPHHGEIPHKVPVSLIKTSQKNIAMKSPKGAVHHLQAVNLTPVKAMAALKAVLPAAKRKAFLPASLIQAARLMVMQGADPHRAANRIQAG